MKTVSVLSFVLLFNLMTYCSEELEFVPDFTPMEFDDFFSSEQGTAVPTSEVSSSIDLTPDPPADSSSHERTEATFKKCPLCDKTIAVSGFDQHERAHNAIKKRSSRYPCQVGCPFRATSITALAQHHKMEHGKGTKVKHADKWVGVATYFRAKGGRSKKRALSKAPSPKICPVCFLYFQPGKHEHTHTGEEILCDICPFKSDSNQTMQRHRRVEHDVNRTHYCKCQKCKGKFIGQSTFFKHKSPKKKK